MYVNVFFQAVSNSSWANYGYLITKKITGQGTLKELRLLFAAHGIGLIQLDADNLTQSQILIPARERDAIDWDMVNRLSKENSDFSEYVRLIKEFCLTGRLKPTDWDTP